ncbi:hypothetical protein MON38_16010 [Hymenobacter sp. DH14]|uniref:Uncharacterized protein n=1 Tax=Hymenobacter cyanobacteriorum TaxID=2926463 RepID=A0A9X1VIQ2_9BACT|nr:hypothetical protein [Hymenobacter cyanobacteriorum]MCI1188928.1 hypothetical protein [Hymenobacter cyanobacteriorum]
MRSMLAHNAGGLVEKMRRNTWYEVVFTLGIVVVVPFYAWHSWGKAMELMLAASMLLVSSILLINYYQQLQLLRRMGQPDIQVRAHLVALCAGLRQRLRFYYRFTLATLPYMLLMLWAFHVGKELAHPGAFHWKFILVLAAAYVVLGAIVQVAIIYLTRWYLQRLYGQHLDRFEANLRELDEDEPGRAG